MRRPPCWETRFCQGENILTGTGRYSFGGGGRKTRAGGAKLPDATPDSPYFSVLHRSVASRATPVRANLGAFRIERRFLL